MEHKFFLRRFRNYFLLLIIPTFLVFAISFIVVNAQIDRELDERGQSTLSNVNTNLDFVISSVVLQNDQLTNNSYMVLALKKLLQKEPNIQYSDAIYLRNIRTMLSSIIQSYPYIQSVYLYLDDYSSYFSSEDGVVEFARSGDTGWRANYETMSPDAESMVESRYTRINGRDRQMLTIYQRFLLLDGTIVMNIDVGKYCSLLDKILRGDSETVLFYNQDGSLLFAWNNLMGDSVQACDFHTEFGQQQQNRWTTIGGQRYLVHTEFNNSYSMYLVSLISFEAKLAQMIQMLKLFGLIFLINSIAMLLLAYVTTDKSFRQLRYLIQVFSNAENGIYPEGPRAEMRDEYDVILNNVIYLFLNTIQLNSELVQKQHEQEVAELTALQLQINPHFLFNTLQNVQLEIKKIDKGHEQANWILDHLSDILKYALADPLETISLEEEIQYLKKYVAIQQFRFGERFIIYYEIEEDLMDIQVFRLMLQPLVENSILHGIRQKTEPGYIKIQIFRKRNSAQIHMRVVDNGVGMTKEEIQRLMASMESIDVHHIGLANVHSRLKLHYGEQAGIRVRSKAGVGCVMEFVIPAGQDEK